MNEPSKQRNYRFLLMHRERIVREIAYLEGVNAAVLADTLAGDASYADVTVTWMDETGKAYTGLAFSGRIAVQCSCCTKKALVAPESRLTPPPYTCVNCQLLERRRKDLAEIDDALRAYNYVP